MTQFTICIAAAAAALAVLPAAAHAAEGARGAVAVRIADLDLASPGGMAQFHRRVNVAAQRFCADELSLERQYACQAGVRIEMREKLAAVLPATRYARR